MQDFVHQQFELNVFCYSAPGCPAKLESYKTPNPSSFFVDRYQGVGFGV